MVRRTATATETIRATTEMIWLICILVEFPFANQRCIEVRMYHRESSESVTKRVLGKRQLQHKCVRLELCSWVGGLKIVHQICKIGWISGSLYVLPERSDPTIRKPGRVRNVLKSSSGPIHGMPSHVADR